MTPKQKNRKSELAALISDRLALAYNRDIHRAAALAEVCDETTDRSGSLLGWIREYAAIARGEVLP
jgi:hypothetical protein